jgi:hypothetical protein
MGAVFGASVDLIHAVLMAAWVLGLPLLFWRRWPRLSRGYAVFAIGFIIANQLSRVLIGECFLTSIARAAWQSSAPPAGLPEPDEWFTVRLARTVFRMTPSHQAIKTTSEALILVTAVGVVFRSLAGRGRALRSPPSHRAGTPAA